MRFEAEVRDCEVEGEIPPDLEGTFYRVGPNRVYPPRFADDIPYNGDGMASLFRFAGGRCDYRQRYIETERYLLERAAGRALFGRYRNRFTNDPSVPADASLGSANTHVYLHAGKLMALKEDSLPVLLDPHTLATTDNKHSFDGQVTSLTFSAHPKVDAASGEMIAYGYEAKGDCTTDVAVYSFDRDGKKTWEAWFKAPYVCMMHDCAVTANWVLIPTTGMATSMERLKAGLVHWGYDPARPIHVAAIPRGGSGEDVRWFQAPHRCVVHTVAAMERNGTLVMDVQASDSNGMVSFANVDGTPFDPVAAESTIRRWTMDLGSGDERVREEVLFSEIKSALPRIDDRYLFGAYRYGYVAESGLRSATPYDAKAAHAIASAESAFARFDIESGEVVSTPIGPGLNAAEPVFAPRRPDSPEGDGWLLAVASNAAEMRSELVIADAQRLEDGVIARVILPFRAHLQVHGNWIPRWELGF
jgi:carotenoid cleavage dioxygenase